MTRRKLLSLFCVLLVLLSPFGIHWLHRSNAVDVDTETGRVRVIRESVLASGSLIYDEEALLSPELIGRVTAVLVKEGDQVAKGQVVLRIDDQTYRDAVAQQDATVRAQQENVRGAALDLGYKKSQLERLRNLRPSGYISKADFDTSYYAFKAAEVANQTARHTLDEAKASLHQQDELLAKTVIRAPMAGTVVAVSIKPGETAVPSAIGIPGSSLVTIANRQSIRVDLNVDENDIAHLALGQNAAIHCPPLPDVALPGHVKSIALGPRRATLGAAASSNARSYSVKIDINDKRAAQLRPGMDCRAEIYTSEPPATFSIPLQAMLSEHTDDSDGLTGSGSKPEKKGPYYVFVDADGYARRRVVVPGESDDTYQEIKQGVAPDEHVIVGPYRTLRSLSDGDRVNSTQPH